MLTGSGGSGVNYVGYLSSALGLGEAARGNIVALQRQGVDVIPIDVGHLCGSEGNGLGGGQASAAAPVAPIYDTNVIHVNADLFPALYEYLGADYFRGRYNIGVWAWEAPRFPRQWWDCFTHLDEIWVGGTFMAQSISLVAPVPVIHIPHVVDVPAVEPDRASFGLDPAETLFLFMFDFNSTPSRKNPEGAIEAFRLAFRPDEAVRLVVKSMNRESRPDVYRQLFERARGLRVTFIDETLNGQRRYQLLNSCDVFLSLHRAEGFGLGIAEAMAYGKPVIATGWSGNMDFMHVGNSYPVAFDLKPLARSDPPYEAGTLWAEPNLRHAAELMRKVADDPVAARAISERARRDTRQLLSVEHVGALMSERLGVVDALCRSRASHDHLARRAVRVGAVKERFGVRSVRWVLRKGWRGTRAIVPARLRPAATRLAQDLKRRLGFR